MQYENLHNCRKKSYQLIQNEHLRRESCSYVHKNKTGFCLSTDAHLCHHSNMNLSVNATKSLNQNKMNISLHHEIPMYIDTKRASA